MKENEIGEDKVKFFTRIKHIVKRPKEYFDFVREEGWHTPLLFFLLLQALIFPVFTGINYFFSIDLPLLEVLIRTMIGFIATIIVFHLIVGFFHLFVLMTKESKGLVKTYQAFVYGMTPVIILSPLYSLSWIFTIIGNVYGFYITVLGTKELHELSIKKTVIVFLIPASIWLILFLILFPMQFIGRA